MSDPCVGSQPEILSLIIRLGNQIDRLFEARNRVNMAGERLLMKPAEETIGNNDPKKEPYGILELLQYHINRNDELIKYLEEDLSYLEKMV